MTDETVIDPIVDPNAPAPEQGAEAAAPVAAEAEAPAAEAAPAEPEAAPAEPKRDPWWNKRISELTWAKSEEQRHREAAESRAKALEDLLRAQGIDPAASAESAALTPEDVDRLASVKAQELARQQTFNEACNRTFEEGRAKHADFEQAVAQLQATGAATVPLITAALETGAAPDVLHYLGTNPEEALRIAAMQNPTRQAIEMDRLAQKLRAPAAPQVSKAPAPIAPVGSTVAADTDIYNPELSDDAYYAARAKAGARWVPGARAN